MDYEKARRRAALARLIGAMLRKPASSLVSLAEAKCGYTFVGQAHSGLQQIPVNRIVGSMDRVHEFDRNFNPRTGVTRARWESVNRAYLNDVILPPIEVQKLGDDYFVTDGHHRVSVARFHGVEYIDAEVTEYPYACQAA